MILAALALVFALAAAIGTAGPMAVGAIRQGREAFLQVAAERAAEGRLAAWFEEPWVDSTAGGAVGTRIAFTPDSLPTARLERTLEAVAPSVWILEVRAAILDRGGAIRARARRGWLVRTDSLPGDSTRVGRVISRSRVAGFQ